MFKRIMMFGRPGSGKSTFAKELHNKAGIELYHLDRYFYTKNWIERSTHEFFQIQQNLVNQDCWIIDGNNVSSLGIRYACADVVLYFNYPKWLCLYRIFKRRFFKNPQIKDRAEGCSEIIKWKLITYMWTFEKRVHEQLKYLQQQYPHAHFIEIRNNKDLNQAQKFILSQD